MTHFTPRSAPIEGHIQEAGGRLLADVPVYLMHYGYDQRGTRGIKIVATAMTDDRGWYRIFWTPPGPYILAAGGPPSWWYSSDEFEPERRPVLFYPDHADLARAEAIDIDSGAERVVDWSLPKLQTYRIRARLTDSKTGRPPAKADVQLDLRDAPDYDSQSTDADDVHYDATTGVFEIEGLVSGIYEVTIRDAVDPVNRSVSRVVRIGNENLDGLDLDFSQPAPALPPIRGRITTTRGANLPADDSVSSFIFVFRPEHGEDREFDVELDGGGVSDGSTLVTGEAYRVWIEELPAGWYVREVRLGGADALRKAVAVQPGAELEITLRPRAASIEGVINDASGRPVSKVIALLVPNQASERPDPYAIQDTDEKGHFKLETVAPGDYTVYAWEDGALPSAYAYYDPAVMARFAGKGAAVHVEGSSKAKVNVTLIPAIGAAR